jgi:hypothetical protein
MVGGAITVVGLAVFGAVQLRHRQPLADLRLFRIPAFLSANVVLLTSQVCVMAVTFWALWLQLSLGLDPLRAGLLLLPSGLPILVMGRIGGRWADRAGAHEPIRVGAFLCLLSTVWMAVTLPRNDYLLSVAGMLLYGIGAPLVISPAIKTVLLSVPPVQAGGASGMLNTMRQLGAALCFGGVGAVVNSVEHSGLRELWASLPVAAGQVPAGFDTFQALAAARTQADPALAAQLIERVQGVNGRASGAGMWVAAAFATLGLAFALLGLGREPRQAAALSVTHKP